MIVIINPLALYANPRPLTIATMHGRDITTAPKVVMYYIPKPSKPH
jgi:hypothetical protein